MGVEGTYPLLLALWLVPLACAIALWAFGPQLKTAAGPIGAGLVGVCFAMALFSWPESVQRARGTIGAHITLFSWGSGRADLDAHHHGRRFPDHHLRDRLYGRRRQLPALLRVYDVLRLRDADA